MNSVKFAAILLLISGLSIGLLANETDIPGLPAKLSVQKPAGVGPFPCVIICPGRGYHMELPLIKDFADQAVLAGFVALRFDWTFYTRGTNPSADGMQELGDIETMLNLAKQTTGVDTTRIYIAGKSFGSLYGYAVFQEHKELKGCLLLTPIIPDGVSGADYYPGLADESRKVVFILGSEDYNNCRLNNLYSYLAGCKNPIPVVALAGAHSFNQAGESQDERLLGIDVFNLQQAVSACVYWLKTFENPVYTE